MAADESNTMSATLRFPFQASLDGSTMVETNGSLFFGLDAIHYHTYDMAAEEKPQPQLQPQLEEPKAKSKSEPEPEPEPELESDLEPEPEQLPKSIVFPPRWDSLFLNNEIRNSENVVPRPVSLLPHRIDTSDQQRFASAHEMHAEATEGTINAFEVDGAEEDNVFCESPTSTIDAPELQSEMPPKQLPVPSHSLPRFYATPIDKDDPQSTPVLLYGLEKPSGYTSDLKKLMTVHKQSRPQSMATAARPLSRHSAGGEQVPPKSRRRLSLFGKPAQDTTRTSPTPPPLPSHSITRPVAGSISSTGSSATTSTARSGASTANSNYTLETTYTSKSIPKFSASSSPVLSPVPSIETPVSDKPLPFARASTMTALDSKDTPNRNIPSSLQPGLPGSQIEPSKPARSNTTPVTNHLTESTTSVSGESSRRTMVFSNFSRRFLNNRFSVIQKDDNLAPIHAVPGPSRQGAAVSPLPSPLPSPPSPSPSAKLMPFSPDSIGPQFARPKETTTISSTNNSYSYSVFSNKMASSSQTTLTTRRPQTSYHRHSTSFNSGGINNTPLWHSEIQSKYSTQKEYRGIIAKETVPERLAPERQIYKPHRATKFFSRIFVADINDNRV